MRMPNHYSFLASGMGQMIGAEPSSDLDRLIAMHPEIMQKDTGERSSDFVFRWFARDSSEKPEDALRQLLQRFGRDFNVGQRYYPDRQSTLVVVWRRGYLDSTPTVTGTRGERYLPSGQLIEWELDAAGKPRTLKVDGVSVDPALLSKAKKFTVDEMISFDAKADMMRIEYVFSCEGAIEWQQSDVRSGAMFREAHDPYLAISSARDQIRERAEKVVRSKNPGCDFQRTVDSKAWDRVNEASLWLALRAEGRGNTQRTTPRSPRASCDAALPSPRSQCACPRES